MLASDNERLDEALKRTSDEKLVKDREWLAIESELHLAKSTADRHCLEAERAHKQLRSAEIQLASTTAALKESPACRTSRDILGCTLVLHLMSFASTYVI